MNNIKILFILLLAFLSSCGGVKVRDDITQDTKNIIAMCSVGIDLGVKTETIIGVGLEKELSELNGVLSVEYKKYVKNSILSNSNISSEVKEIFLDKYFPCISDLLDRRLEMQASIESDRTIMLDKLIGSWKGGPVPGGSDKRKRFVVYNFKRDGSVDQKMIYEDNKQVPDDRWLSGKELLVEGWGKFTISDNKLNIVWNGGGIKEIVEIHWFGLSRFRYVVVDHDVEERKEDDFMFNKLVQ